VVEYTNDFGIPHHPERYQDVTNKSWPPPDVARRLSDHAAIPVIVRIVWGRDGETHLDGTATRWAGQHVFVRFADERSGSGLCGSTWRTCGGGNKRTGFGVLHRQRPKGPLPMSDSFTPLAVLTDAVHDRAVLEFEYNGHHRVVQPSAHGLNLKGNESLRGYQIGGSSRSGRMPPWRMFKVAQIQGLILTGDTFTDEPEGYRCGDLGMTVIFADLCDEVVAA
jgi:hypothetical protein